MRWRQGSLLGCRGLYSLEAEKGSRETGMVYLKGMLDRGNAVILGAKGMFTAAIGRRAR